MSKNAHTAAYYIDGISRCTFCKSDDCIHVGVTMCAEQAKTDDVLEPCI